MPEIIKRNKALSVNPLKSSQTIGAALATLGFYRSIPMFHGSQGCTAFGKVFFVRHFREPIPLQTTAMDQISTVMGSDKNIIEGLHTICEKFKPSLIILPTTGLSETQGCDVKSAVTDFRKAYPQHHVVPVVPVSTPDYAGCLESGFAAATAAVIEALVPPADEAGTVPGRQARQVNVLVGSSLTPGDIETLKEMLEAFHLQPVIVPDLSDALDGHLSSEDFTPLTMGGTPVPLLRSLGDAVATLVIGRSMHKTADLLKQRTGVPDYRFDHLMTLEMVDDLLGTLSRLYAVPVPARFERQRAQLQDAMLDCHFMLGMKKIAIAADPDLLNALSHLMNGMGAEVVAAVASSHAPVLKQVASQKIKLGDLEDLEKLAAEGEAQLVIGNSHAVASAKRLGLPVLRAGFPQYDYLGGYQRRWIGYQGIRQTLFDLANIFLSHSHAKVIPYRSIYSQKHDHYSEEAGYVPATALENRRM